MIPRRPRSALITLLVLLACGAGGLVLGGCGAASVVDPVARAADVSNAAPGMRLTMTAQISAGPLPAPIVMNGQGAVEIPTHTGTFSATMHLPNLPQLTHALGSSTLQVNEVFSGTTIYMKVPSALAKHVPGKPWLKLDLSKTASAAGIPGLSTLTNNPASNDPSQFLRYLRATSGGVTKVGTATVDGFATTHYRGQIKLDRVPSTFPAASRAQARQAIAALEQVAQLKVLPFDVWIDQHQLVRRMQFAYQATVAGQSVREAFTIDFPQYGPQPAPTLPPASQVTAITASSLGGGSAP